MGTDIGEVVVKVRPPSPSLPMLVGAEAAAAMSELIDSSVFDAVVERDAQQGRPQPKSADDPRAYR
jgi:hypothetical protein